MKYLLDTNVLISMFKNQHGIREKIKSVGFESCVVSELTEQELRNAVYAGSWVSDAKRYFSKNTPPTTSPTNMSRAK